MIRLSGTHTVSKKIFVGDFETTVYEGQKSTEVWAAAVVELGSENPIVFHSISALFDYFASYKLDIICYFHNLKFDGMFWIYHLMVDKKFELAIEGEGDDREFIKDKYMSDDTYKYMISDRGMFYTLTYKHEGHTVTLRDSLKLLPFSVKQIGKAFDTKHQKLDMEYEGYRYAGCTITEKEMEYIKNDVLVPKEALELMFDEGHKKLTIGSCCLSEFKSYFYHRDWKELFPNLKEFKLDEAVHGAPNADAWIRKSYRGGWCYLVPEKAHRIIKNGLTADVNSLYPSRMLSESGCQYPVGLPIFWVGDIPKDLKSSKSLYYFVRIKCRFDLKEGYLPFIQIKGSMLYPPTQNLTTSKIWDKKNRRYLDEVSVLGRTYTSRVELTFNMTEYELFLEHYDAQDMEVIDGCYFLKDYATFDRYIEKYAKIKKESVGAKRTLAKLYLNNLYGKMASSDNASFKVAYLRDDESLGFETVINHEKEPVYIPIGSAITGYAREFTIRAAQKNFHGADKEGFIYADTDSIHCDFDDPSKLIDIPIHPTDFNCWAIESRWDTAYFVRQKTYIEIVDGNLDIKCAGMPERCKNLFIKSMQDLTEVTDDVLKSEGYNAEEIEFIRTKRDITDFDIGLRVPSKLKPHQIKGGVVLKSEFYEMR